MEYENSHDRSNCRVNSHNNGLSDDGNSYDHSTMNAGNDDGHNRHNQFETKICLLVNW